MFWTLLKFVKFSGQPQCTHSRSHRYYKRSINAPQCYKAISKDRNRNKMGFHAKKPSQPTEYFLTVSVINPLKFVPVGKCQIW